jgi:hypothetical protein
MSKKLFMLRRGRNGTLVDGVYFGNKLEAKQARDSGDYGTGLVVTYGIDHKLYNQ